MVATDLSGAHRFYSKVYKWERDWDHTGYVDSGEICQRSFYEVLQFPLRANINRYLFLILGLEYGKHLIKKSVKKKKMASEKFVAILASLSSFRRIQRQ